MCVRKGNIDKISVCLFTALFLAMSAGCGGISLHPTPEETDEILKAYERKSDKDQPIDSKELPIEELQKMQPVTEPSANQMLVMHVYGHLNDRQQKVPAYRVVFRLFENN